VTMTANCRNANRNTTVKSGNRFIMAACHKDLEKDWFLLVVFIVANLGTNDVIREVSRCQYWTTLFCLVVTPRYDTHKLENVSIVIVKSGIRYYLQTKQH
jgi:hypothetical protein